MTFAYMVFLFSQEQRGGGIHQSKEPHSGEPHADGAGHTGTGHTGAGHTGGGAGRGGAGRDRRTLLPGGRAGPQDIITPYRGAGAARAGAARRGRRTLLPRGRAGPQDIPFLLHQRKCLTLCQRPEPPAGEHPAGEHPTREHHGRGDVKTAWRR